MDFKGLTFENGVKNDIFGLNSQEYLPGKAP